MSTKRNPGIQYSPKGVVQGNSLVNPNTGNPVSVTVDVNNKERLCVDAEITAETIVVDTRPLQADIDNVEIKDPDTGAHIKVESDGSINTNIVVSAANGDNIAINDGTDTLNINSDGSVNIHSLDLSTTPIIFTVPVLTANTEVSQALPSGTKKFSIKVRDYSSKLQLAFTVGQSGTNYIQMVRGVSFSEDNINVTSLTLYFQTNIASQIVEIVAWT